MGDGVGDFAFWLAIGGMGTSLFWVLAPVFKAVADRIASGGSGGERVAELEARLAELEHRGLTSGEVEQAYVRLAEMEERVEFAERMLTQQMENPARLASGGDT